MAKKENEEIKEEKLNEETNEEMTKTQEELEKEVERLTKENDKYYTHLQRTAAEFENYKKRVGKEKDTIYSLAVGDVVTKYLQVLDNLEKAINTETKDEKMKEGVSLIYKQMLDLMKSLNVEVIETVNQKFNPELHDAVMHIESEEYGEKIVVEELRKGYKIGKRVLRHAMVKVAN